MQVHPYSTVMERRPRAHEWVGCVRACVGRLRIDLLYCTVGSVAPAQEIYCICTCIVPESGLVKWSIMYVKRE